MKTCPKCNFTHEKTGKFCSRSCANSRGPRTKDFKRQVSEKLTGKKGHNVNKGKQFSERIYKHCLSCKKEFESILNENRKYCSNDCWKQNSGGYRAGSGRSKSGYYKGIYCGSTYELCWVIHSIDHKIEFTRFTDMLERDGVKYYPDFLLGDGKTIIETKGYEKQDSVDVKSAVAESYGFTVKVLRKEDLLYAFDYVKQQYGTEQYHTLYDGYKPKFSYTCGHCATEFSRDKKLKTDIVFCSRQCAGKYRNSYNQKNSFDKENANYKRLLTKNQALEIYNRTDKSLQDLADEFNIPKNNVWFIKQRRTYKWIHN